MYYSKKCKLYLCYITLDYSLININLILEISDNDVIGNIPSLPEILVNLVIMNNIFTTDSYVLSFQHLSLCSLPDFHPLPGYRYKS